MRKATTTSLLTLICVTHLLLAQSLGPNAEGFRLHIGPATDITVDGVLDEPVWQTAEQATNFQVNNPIDGKTADWQTVVQMAYDDRNLYVAATCYDSSDYVIQSLKRDTWGESDDFAVFLDPFNQRS
ncbi:MAG: hypothetical protein KDC54_07560, partial [Lewinella sp.]|nr:hypothetical protein [Lewinella sp.]